MARSITTRFMLGLLFAFILTALPVPVGLSGFKPVWVLLYILYIQFYLPQYIHALFLLLIGLCLDVLLSATLGEHAFALIFTIWLISEKSRRFEFFPISQQLLLVFLCCLIYQAIIFFIDAFQGYHYDIFPMLCSAFLSLLFWPWIKMLLDYFFIYGKILSKP